MSLQISNWLSEELQTNLYLTPPLAECLIPRVLRHSQLPAMKCERAAVAVDRAAAMKKWKFPPAFGGGNLSYECRFLLLTSDFALLLWERR
jgi:hypothetical protein